MTSSLVGSEMCIRDSGSSVGAGQARAGCCSEGFRTVVRRCRPAVGLRLGCLLYTSDAADDM
eukprot:3608320-Prorocentrum_lima.AAC.1